MFRREYLLGSIGAGLAALGGRVAAQPAPDPLRATLKHTVGRRETVAGMVAVTIEGNDTRIAACGSSGVAGLAMDGDTVFEMMSITKIFTSLVLADMVVRGEVAFDDPVAKYLPVALHARGRPITLLDLASYRSGLPLNPSADWRGYDDLTEARVLECLSRYVPKHAPGTHYEYANFAFGVLGIALARRAGKSYETLLMERICNPLGLNHTRITLTNEMQRHLVQGHDLDLKPVARWNVPALPGMAFVCSNAKDLTVFLKVCMGLTPSPLREPLARLLQTRGTTSLAGTDTGLGWFVTSDRGEDIVWKSGLGGGCNTFIGFSRQKRRGAIVLSNFIWRPIDTGTINLGMDLIEPDFHPVDFKALYPFF